MSVLAFSGEVGRRLARSNNATTWLVGRRLEARATLLARPAAAGAALILVLGCGTAILTRPDDSTETSSPGGPYIYVATWVGPDPASVVRARNAHANWTVVPMDGRGAQASRCHGRLACVNGTLADGLRQQLRGHGVGSVDVPINAPTGALLAVPGPVSDADLIGALGAPSVVSIDRWSDPGSSGGTTLDWVLAAVLTGGLILGLLILREAGERTLMAAVHDRPLRRLSIGSARLERVRWLGTGVPFVIAFPVATATAVMYSYFGAGAGLTTFVTGRVVAVATLCTLGALLVVSGATVMARRTDEVSGGRRR